MRITTLVIGAWAAAPASMASPRDLVVGGPVVEPPPAAGAEESEEVEQPAVPSRVGAAHAAAAPVPSLVRKERRSTAPVSQRWNDRAGRPHRRPVGSGCFHAVAHPAHGPDVAAVAL